MQIYHYHPNTFEYVGSSVADPDPLDPGRWLIPRNATAQAPPTPGEGFKAVWTVAGWTVVSSSTPEPEEPIQTIDELKELKINSVNSIRDGRIAAGVLYTFPGDVPGTVQTRDLTDHRNIQANASAAQMYLLNSQPAAEMQFRDMEDVVHTLTATEMVQMCSHVMGYGQAIYSASWAHKDAISELGTVEAVSAYDVTTGWPV